MKKILYFNFLLYYIKANILLILYRQILFFLGDFKEELLIMDGIRLNPNGYNIDN